MDKIDRLQEAQMYINSIKKAKEVSITLENVKDITIRWLLPPEAGTPNFEMRYFEIKKGGYSRQETHPWEHEVFVVKGRGIVRGKDREKVVEVGDAILIAPNEFHQFRSTEEKDFGFICVIPNGAEDEVLKEFKPNNLLKD